MLSGAHMCRSPTRASKLYAFLHTCSSQKKCTSLYCRYTDWRPNLLHGVSTAVFVGSRTVDPLLPPALIHAHITSLVTGITHTHTPTPVHTQTKHASTHTHTHAHAHAHAHAHTNKRTNKQTNPRKQTSAQAHTHTHAQTNN